MRFYWTCILQAIARASKKRLNDTYLSEALCKYCGTSMEIYNLQTEQWKDLSIIYYLFIYLSVCVHTHKLIYMPIYAKNHWFMT
jgi:hypothetical protein